MPIYTPGASPIVCNGHRDQVVWQNTANGPVIRRKTYNKRFLGVLSTSSRARMLSAVGAWKNLTSMQQIAWDAAASSFVYTDSCGNNYTLSGQQLFFKSAKRLLDRPAAINTATPSPIGLGTAVINFLTINAGTNNFTVNADPAPLPGNTFGKLEATQPLPPGISNPGTSGYYFLRTVAPAGTGAYNLQPFYSNQFPLWNSQVGQKISVRWTIEDLNFGLEVSSTFAVIIIS
jgi:hypothetical protein